MAPLYNEEADAAFYTEGESSSTPSTSTSPLSPSFSNEQSYLLRTTVPVRRSVSFSPGAEVHFGAVIHIDDYSEAEKYDCWYHADEMREIRREVKDTVALMNRNAPIHEINRVSEKKNDAGMYVTFSTRGLEGKTREEKRYRRENRLASLSAVFDEQTLQEMDGISDPTFIAMAYAEYSYPMQIAAFQRAAEYLKEAAAFSMNINNEDEHQSSPFSASASANTSSSVNGEAIVGQNECRSTSSSRNHLELETTEDGFESSLFFDDKVTSSDSTANTTSKNNDGTDDLEYLEIVESTNHPYNSGAFRIRDRFACLLSGSASNSTRSLMGAFRVVQI